MISPVRVIAQPSFHKISESPLCATLTGTPGLSHALGPVDPRFEGQLQKLERPRPPLRHFQPARSLLWRIRALPGEAGLPEWREDLIRLALLIAYLPRLEQERAVEALRTPALFLQRRFDQRIPLDRCGFIAAVPEHL